MTAIVVDASVAFAASEIEKEPARACWQCLRSIEEGPLSVAMTKDVHDEWRKHAKNYARAWLRRMVARKRFRRVAVDPAVFEQILDLAELHFGEQVAKIRAVQKDIRLIEAALASDRRILSADEVVRAYFAECLGGEWGVFYWAGPAHPGACAWLTAGAPDDDTFRLE